ncbi:MAG: hypothetical protein HQK87_07445 [Nitrospinae bacterium]|nr:hypothetical protein [Nitrospinota bacterium]
MNPDKTGDDLPQRLFTLTLIWASLTISVGFYALVLYLLDGNGALPMAALDGESTTSVTLALLVTAAIGGSSVFTLPGLLMKPETLRARFRAKGIDPASLDRDRLATALFPQYQAIGIVRWAMGESVGLMGLVAALLTGLGPLPYGLLGASAALLVVTRPSRAGLDALVTAVRGI